jgi:hypothetical protein
MADRGGDSLPFPIKRETYEREIFGHFSWSVFKNKRGVGLNDYRFTISFSLLRSAANIAAVLALVDDSGGLVKERG